MKRIKGESYSEKEKDWVTAQPSKRLRGKKKEQTQKKSNPVTDPFLVYPFPSFSTSNFSLSYNIQQLENQKLFLFIKSRNHVFQFSFGMCSILQISLTLSSPSVGANVNHHEQLGEWYTWRLSARQSQPHISHCWIRGLKTESLSICSVCMCM